MSEEKKYTRKELYEGYYWLILHTSPFHAPGGLRGDGGWIIISDYWETEMPDCLETVAENNILFQLRDSPSFASAVIVADLMSRGKYFPGRNNVYDTTAIFNWFKKVNIPRLKVEDRDIMNWRDLRTLWTKIKVVDSYGRETLLIEADWFKKAEDGVPLYRNHSKDVFNALEHYLAKQHKENLEKLETPAPQAGEEATLPWKKVERFAKEYKWLIELIASVIARVWKTP